MNKNNNIKHKRKSYKKHDDTYVGTIKSMYMRLMIAVLVAMLFSSLITTVFVYGWRSWELVSYINDQMKREFDSINAFIDRYNSSVDSPTDRLGKDEIQLLISEIFGNKYICSVYDTAEEALSALGGQFTDADYAMLNKDHTILFKNSWFVNTGVAKIGNVFVQLKATSSNTASLNGIWFNIVWTTGFLTIVVALIINSLTIKMVIKPIKLVSEGMQAVSQGNFDIKLAVEGNDEMAVLQRNFNIMTEGLKQNDEMSKNFASMVSHEYKTPIAAIAGYAQLLSDGNLSEKEQKQYIKTILDQSRRLSNLSVNMLQLARLDSSTVGLSKTIFRVDEQIRNVVVNMENLWETKNIDLDINLISVKVYCNDQMLYHVWENLLSNAIKFSSVGSKISITNRIENDTVFITFSDSGCGIAPDDLPHIFERFYKSNSEINANGSGLGLTITKKITELSGGNISVISTPNQGSAFTVSLPVC